MKTFLLFFFVVALALPSCTSLGSHTAVYYPNGQLAYETVQDSTGHMVHIKNGAFTFTEKDVTSTHSTSITAHGNANEQFINALGKAAGPIIQDFVKP